MIVWKKNKEHFRRILLNYFRKGKYIKIAQVSKKLRDVYGGRVLKETQCQSCFVKFRLGDFLGKDSCWQTNKYKQNNARFFSKSAS